MHPISELRARARAIFAAGLRAADPGEAVRASLRANADGISIRRGNLVGDEGNERHEPWSHVRVLAFGRCLALKWVGRDIGSAWSRRASTVEGTGEK